MTEIYSYELQYRNRQQQFLDEAEYSRLVAIARRSRRRRIKQERRAQRDVAVATQPAAEALPEIADAVPRQRTDEREHAHVA